MDILYLTDEEERPAIVLLQPPISIKFCPERTEQTKYFTGPLPIPKRTPSDFFVIDVIGKARIQIFACFFSLRWNSRRKDSNCLCVTRPESRATMEKSPKAKESGYFLFVVIFLRE
jgi:hypothetical protein